MMDEMLEIFDVMPSCCGALGYVVVGLLGCWALFHLWSRKKVYSFKEKHVLVSVNGGSLNGEYSSFVRSLPQITGGSSGIGKALAAEALKRGAAVVTLVARKEVSRLRPSAVVHASLSRQLARLGQAWSASGVQLC